MPRRRRLSSTTRWMLVVVAVLVVSRVVNDRLQDTDPGEPGELISSEPLTLRDSGGELDAFRLKYWSTGADGEPIEALAIVLLPPGEAPPGGWDVLAYAHGTAGAADTCSPALGRGLDSLVSLAAGPLTRNTQAVVVMTDYEGLGVPGGHPYAHGPSAARTVTDSVRAARAVVDDTTDRWAVFGHSQGGHAALFVAEEATSYAPELDLVGAIAVAPLTRLVDVAADTGPPLGGIVGLMAAGLEVVEPDVDLSTVMTTVGMEAVEASENICEDGLNQTYSDTPPAEMVQPGAIEPGTPFGDYLRSNEPGSRPATVPVLVTQGGQDFVTPTSRTNAAIAQMCAAGSTVQLEEIAEADHVSILYLSATAMLTWLDDRFAGRPAPSAC